MLIPFIFSLMTLFATCCIEYGTLTMRHRLSTHILVRVVAYSFGSALFFLLVGLGVKNPLWYYCISIVYFLICNFLFAENAPQKLFLFFSDWCFTTFDSSLCNWATAWIDAENLRLIARLGLYGLSFIILLPLYFTYARQYVKEMLNLFNKVNPIYSIFPVLSLILFTILFGPLNPASTVYQFLTMALFICFILFTFYLMIVHFHTIYKRLQVENHLMNAERQLILQKKYYAEVDKGVRVQKEQMHDLRHHMVALSTLASAKKLDDISRYIASLEKRFSQLNTPRYCENDIANAVLGGYIGMAEEKRITVSAELDLPQTMGIDEYELCTLFGNTLENAIEACQRIPVESPLFSKRYIKLKSRVDQGRLTIRIENSFLNDSSPPKGGIGLESVKTVVNLYQGCMNCERLDKDFIFSAVLCLKDTGSRGN